MEMDEMLSLLTLGAVLPYLATAAIGLAGKFKAHHPGAKAPV